MPKMNGNYIITSDQVQIRLTSENDLDFVLQTEHHEDNIRFITPWTREQHRNSIESPDSLHLVIENRRSEPVGYMIVNGLQNQNRCIELMRIVISDKSRGYGKSAIRLMQEYVFNHLGAHRLWLDVKDHNERAFNLYKSLGFQYECMLRECLKAGDGYESLIIMGILKREFDNLDGNG